MQSHAPSVNQTVWVGLRGVSWTLTEYSFQGLGQFLQTVMIVFLFFSPMKTGNVKHITSCWEGTTLGCYVRFCFKFSLLPSEFIHIFM